MLPASTLCGEPSLNMLMQVKYRLVAQLEPSDDEEWVARFPELGISQVRHETDVFVNYNETRVAQPKRNIVKEINTKVGGFLGIGKT